MNDEATRLRAWDTIEIEHRSALSENEARTLAAVIGAAEWALVAGAGGRATAAILAPGAG
ncbi:MAG: hypothetical protein LIP77_07105 [Planctomycetes bacterium]|nr:hypothetical protein [Planctomycetota bacterium]